MPKPAEGPALPGYIPGLITQALAEDGESLRGHSVYMAGPRPMIEAILPLLLEKGAEKERIFSDAFSG